MPLPASIPGFFTLNPMRCEPTKDTKYLFCFLSVPGWDRERLHKLLWTNYRPRSSGSPSPPPGAPGVGRSPAVGPDSSPPPSGHGGTPCCSPRCYRTCSPAGGNRPPASHQPWQTQQPEPSSLLLCPGKARPALGPGGGAEVWGLKDTPGVCLSPPHTGPPGTGTWSVRKSLSSSSRLPPLVAMGTVIFIITPWMGNKPKFWICGQSGGGVSTPSSGWVVGDKVHRVSPPHQPGLRNKFLQAPWPFHCRCSKAFPDLGWGPQGGNCTKAERDGLLEAEDCHWGP